MALPRRQKLSDKDRGGVKNIKKITILILNFAIMVLLVNSFSLELTKYLRSENIPELGLVAATVTAVCNNPIVQTNDVCKKHPTQRTAEEAAIAECCSEETGGSGPQEYCWGTTDLGYCTGTLCICHQTVKAEPQQGESYGVASSSECITTNQYDGGKCWYEVPEIVIGWVYNLNLKKDTTVNVYVREEKVWFLDSKGYMIPAKIVITVW